MLEKCHLDKTNNEDSNNNKIIETTCGCGKIFATIKAYAGHKTWCKITGL